MMENKQFQQYLSKAMYWCSKSEKSSGDVLQKLHDWGAPVDFHQTIIEKLKGDNFINDERFAEAFTNDKFKFNKWGKVKIRYALQNKMVDDLSISNALAQIDTNDYKELASELIKNKIQQSKEKEKFKLKQKVLRFMASRGFESGMVFELWDKVGD